MVRLSMKDAKARCENYFDDEEAVAQCVASERLGIEMINIETELSNSIDELAETQKPSGKLIKKRD